MSDPKAEYIAYRLKRSHEALQEAEVMWRMGHYNTYVNRLYYACFYAVSALLHTENLVASTHAGIRNLFTQHFIRDGIISQDFGRLYVDLFQSRQKSDYEVSFEIEPDKVEPWLTGAKAFINEIERIIQERTD